MNLFFVTGTGTAIGKTWVVENLIRHYRGKGVAVSALKPVVSGFDSTDVASSDVGVLLKALGKQLTPAEIEIVSPWRFVAPLSPDMAAAREKRDIPFDDVVAYCQHIIKDATRNASALLIEGIGGVMVPLDESHTVLDLIAALDIPVILVCGSYLGSLSHTLTACAALRQNNIVIDRVIVNQTPGSTVTLAETRDTLKRFLPSLAVEIQTFIQQQAPPIS